MSRDIYAEVTDKLVAAIEENPGDPVMPWHRGGANAIPCNVLTEQEYQGVNILNLWVVGQLSGFTSNIWGTYKQWKKIGAQVRKGEKSTPVVFYKQVVKRSEPKYPSGEGRGGSGLTVAFHGDQLYESFDTERGECEDLDLFSAIDPDDAIFGLHADGEIMEAIDRFAQFCRNAINGFDGVDLVQLHGQAA